MASKEFRYFVKDQIKNTGIESTVFLEPEARNTAATLTMAALFCQQEDPILVVLPSDQVLADSKLNEAVSKAIPACEQGHIVLLGIKPQYPETGYGYIKVVSNCYEGEPTGVECFVEKPDIEKAQKYLNDGGYYWNSGIFIVKASRWLEAIRRCRPDIAKASEISWNNSRQIIDDNELTIEKEAFSNIPAESVDFAVLEHAKAMGIDLDMIPYDGYWTDLGSWKSVLSAIPKDKNGNATIGNVLQQNIQNSLAVSTSRLLVLNHVNNLAVIETSDAVLVSDLEYSQSVKEIVSTLKDQGLTQAVEHRKGRRPWGWYDAIDQGEGFKVKRIVVYPGASLSLQRHSHRSEHWVVVKGEAHVQVGDSVRVVKENESIYIPKKEIHRLTNQSISEIQLIEVQVGDYLGEDDIERLDDRYGRN